MAKFFSHQRKDMLMRSFKTMIAALLLKDGVNQFKQKLDAGAYGGAPLLGAATPDITAHGSSHAKGIKNAIRQAKLCVANDLCGTMEKALAEVAAQKEEADA